MNFILMLHSGAEKLNDKQNNGPAFLTANTKKNMIKAEDKA